VDGIQGKENVMERRFEVRFQEIRAEARVRPDTFRGIVERLEEFVEPFAASLIRIEQRAHAREYVAGLLSDLKPKNTEMIAYLHGQDRQPLQKFIGQVPWNPRPLIGELVRQVGAELGEADGVLVFDPSGFPKQGRNSVGVARQWCGRIGKTDNCQVGIYMGYVSRKEHVLVDFRLFVPKEWSHDRARRAKCGVPKGTRHRTRHELALEMLDAHGAVLPHGWIAGDDEMGRPAEFRGKLRKKCETYLLAVPANTLVRDLDAAPPPPTGSGRPCKVPYVRAAKWVAAQPEKAWTSIDVRDGEKGPIVVQVLKARVQAKLGRRNGPEETLVAYREVQRDGSFNRDYGLSNAPFETPLAEFARVLCAEHRIEECLKRAKSEAGLANYEVRTWEGWHHHQTLSLLASWFLTKEKMFGEKKITEPHRSSSSKNPSSVAV
jgi:SRSO17 transposase